MNGQIDITKSIEPEAASALTDPVRREATGRILSGMLVRGRLRDVLAEAISDAKRDARANGLTDEDIDAELPVWRTEPGS